MLFLLKLRRMQQEMIYNSSTDKSVSINLQINHNIIKILQSCTVSGE